MKAEPEAPKSSSRPPPRRVKKQAQQARPDPGQETRPARIRVRPGPYDPSDGATRPATPGTVAQPGTRSAPRHDALQTSPTSSQTTWPP